MQAKVSKAGLRFFAHDRRTPSCPSSGETPEHRRLKAKVAETIRSLGWTAELEVPGDGWRADVLAISGDCQRRVAFEIQLAGMTAGEGMERTRRYLQDGVETVWISLRLPSWFFQIPGVQVEDEHSGELMVIRGCMARTSLSDVGPTWERPEPFSFRRFVAAVFSGKLVVQRPTRWYMEEIPRGSISTDRYFDNAVGWVRASDWEIEQRERAREQRRLREEEERRKHHEMHRQALIERQQRLTPIAVELAEATTGLVAWGGDSYARRARPRPHKRCAGGIPIFVNPADPRLWAVVCPIAGRIDGWTASRFPASKVFAASEAERERLRIALQDVAEVVCLDVPPETSGPAILPNDISLSPIS
jgi:competence protein CoiA